jgi:hypothetical protein
MFSSFFLFFFFFFFFQTDADEVAAGDTLRLNGLPQSH